MSGPFSIQFSYDKHAAHPVGFGYEARPNTPLTDIVWHSTEHGAGQSFKDVCVYLRDAPDKSVHYMISDAGEIQRILDPGPYLAYHAGYSFYENRYDWNNFSVGIELFHREGGPAYTQAQLDAAAWLAGELLRDKPSITGHVAHRWIACNPYSEQPPVVYGRRDDPTDMSDKQFCQWTCSFKANP